MKLYIKCILLVALNYSCQSPRDKAIDSLENYNQELKEAKADAGDKLDTSFVNAKFSDAGISSIIKDPAMRDVLNEASFKAVLKTEKELLDKWEPAANFKSYSGLRTDTIKTLIRGCSSFDRAPLSAQRVPSAGGMRTASLNYYKVVVPIAFHIIKNKKGDGVLENMTQKINDQVKLLNSVYNPFHISFTISSIDSATNDTWFTQASYFTNPKALQEMTIALNKTPDKLMNVYFLGSRVLGESAYPWYEERQTSMDYIVINYNTLPDGPRSFYDGKYTEGKTLVHEIGHFLGLLHTFEGGSTSCDADPNDGCSIGDQVDDTPGQRFCYFDGCDENANSCPSPGNDPVKNYLGYNPDACMSEITKGQADRMLQCIIKYRYYLVSNPI